MPDTSTSSRIKDTSMQDSSTGIRMRLKNVMRRTKTDTAVAYVPKPKSNRRASTSSSSTESPFTSKQMNPADILTLLESYGTDETGLGFAALQGIKNQPPRTSSTSSNRSSRRSKRGNKKGSDSPQRCN